MQRLQFTESCKVWLASTMEEQSATWNALAPLHKTTPMMIHNRDVFLGSFPSLQHTICLQHLQQATKQQGNHRRNSSADKNNGIP
mmetsp:Transcript_65736/g.157018  ORF Transcript_65736/g.157018 Transcript_65736/m.157018 type:complete len:85 (-) Transcript_65736:115-369(-)